jgi:uncharacterized membrane protein
MASPARQPPMRPLLRARRGLRAGVVQLLGAATGLGLGLVLPRVHGGPTIKSGRMAELLFTLGVGTLGITTVVFSLLFGVVQWTASSFSPRLTLFRGDPLVWRTFGFSLGVFVFGVTAGLSIGVEGRVSLLLPVTVVVAVLGAALLIRELQTRAYRSMQLAHVLQSVTASGHAAINDAYPSASRPPTQPAESRPTPVVRRSILWSGKHCVVQQLDVRRLVEAATQADTLVVFRVRVGSTLHDGSLLADLHGGDLSDDVVLGAVVADVDRSFAQDPLLAFRLLADISLRALSTAVNDPATAVEAIDAIDDLLRALAGRDFQAPDIIDTVGVPRVRYELPGWEDFLRTGVEDLLPAASSSAMVLERILHMLSELLETAPPQSHPTINELRQWAAASLSACMPPTAKRAN